MDPFLKVLCLLSVVYLQMKFAIQWLVDTKLQLNV